MVDAGLIVIVAAISPFRKDDILQNLISKKEFYEVQQISLNVCMKRDPKNLYKKIKIIKGFNKLD